MVKRYQSISFEAFELLPDMSNWREATVFMGLKVTNEYEDNPSFLDVPTANGFMEAVGPCFIAKNPDSGDLEVFKHEDFLKCFKEIQ